MDTEPQEANKLLAGIDALADSIERDAPEVTEGVAMSITGARPEGTHTNLNETSPSTERDSSGELFDPARHEGGKTAGGRWRLKRGRKAGQGSAPAASRSVLGGRAQGAPDAPPAAPAGPDQYDANAASIISLMMASHAGVLGGMWATDPEENKLLVAQLSNVLRLSGQEIKMPWWLAGAAVYTTYLGPRFRIKGAFDRLAGIRDALAGQVKDWWAKRGNANRRAVVQENAKSAAPAATGNGGAPVSVAPEPAKPGAVMGSEATGGKRRSLMNAPTTA